MNSKTIGNHVQKYNLAGIEPPQCLTVTKVINIQELKQISKSLVGKNENEIFSVLNEKLIKSRITPVEKLKNQQKGNKNEIRNSGEQRVMSQRTDTRHVQTDDIHSGYSQRGAYRAQNNHRGGYPVWYNHARRVWQRPIVNVQSHPPYGRWHMGGHDRFGYVRHQFTSQGYRF